VTLESEPSKAVALYSVDSVSQASLSLGFIKKTARQINRQGTISEINKRAFSIKEANAHP